MRLVLGFICLFLGVFASPVLAQDGPVYPRPNYLYNYSTTIAEDQVFAVKYNVPVTENSLQENSYCNIQGLGEKVDTRIINGNARNEILNSLYVPEDEFDSESIHLLQCKRLMPANAKMEIIFGPGVQAINTDAAKRVASKTAYKYGFQVRDDFKADFSCTRSNSSAPCSPLYPVRLNFSSPIEKQYVPEIVLTDSQKTYQADQLKPEYTDEGLLSSISFSGPFPENTEFKLSLPQDLHDDVGRALSNAESFPLSFKMAALPPLVKFATGEFGIIERFANGAPEQNPDILLPVAVRKIGPDLMTQELLLSAGKISDHVLTDSVQAIDWLSRVQRLQSGQLTNGQFADVMAARPMRNRQENEPLIDVRSRSIFTDSDKLNTLDLPGVADITGPEIDMVGIPLSDPGLHIIEVASPELGQSLLDGKADKMYVRTAVLVSNLAVHVKTGRDDVLAWVTSLDDGKPVADAEIQVLSCTGELLATGKTDKHGIWHDYQYQDTHRYCDETDIFGFFVSARIDANHPMAYGKDDFSFAWSSWDRGIEPWRFNIPYNGDPEPDLVAHAVLDRNLLHTDETVSMKIFVRELNRNGLANPENNKLPEQILISHAGSGEEFKIPVKWEKNSGGGLFALAEFKIGAAAKLGEYSIQIPLPTDNEYWQPSLYAGSFRVESFKLPLLTGSLKITDVNADNGNPDILVSPEKIQADLQLAWISGGVAADIDTSLSAVARPLEPYFNDYAEYRFTMPGSLLSEDEQQNNVRRLILDKKPARLGPDGAVLLEIADLPQLDTPQNWLFEMSFKDPNGQIQTIAQTKSVWPADVIIGIESGRWFNLNSSADVKLVVLDSTGKPVANAPVKLDGRQSTTYTTRKRLVGGFYAYDSHEQTASLGTLCQGKTDDSGVFNCPVKLSQNGEVQLIATATDDQGRVAKTGSAIWVWGENSWFGSENNDRMDVIPDKATYKPGEIAELTVRTPFKQALALVAIEREGVLSTEIFDIKASDPVIKIPVKADWSPNVFVSVLAVRGRLREVPWSSFFDWGWHSPKAWLAARNNQSTDVPAPTATVDLAKPAYRFGVVELNISDEADRLQVNVKTDKNTYQIRETAQAEIQVNLPDGKPAAEASVAFAAVDEALLELYDNISWDLLSAMRNKRNYGVSTATAQGEVVGRRHYGRKAIPAGGGGGQSMTRELFDTLLLWQGNVIVDAEGYAKINVPINDSISKFRLVAIADYGENRFGTGMTDIISTQDLQLVSGLPQIIREHDDYVAELTIRNRSKQDMQINLNAEYEYPADKINALDNQDIQLAAGESKTLHWQIKAPELLDGNDGLINWWFSANADQSSDAIKISQKLLAQIPVQAFMADLMHLKPNTEQQLTISVPDNAMRNLDGNIRGGADLVLQSSLAGTMPGVYDWFKEYPYTCIEQQSAKYIGMQDTEKWQQLMHELPKYQDDNGLLSFFPDTSASVVLTAQFVEITAWADDLGWSFKVPRRAQESMLSALQDFVNGRLRDNSWPNLNDDLWLKLIAVNALLKSDGWQNGMLDSLYYDPVDWPTAALVTWISILQDVPYFPDKAELLKLANNSLKARVKYTGTAAVLADESVKQGWWLMSNQATAQARFLLMALTSDYWQDDLPLIFNGLLSLQRNGHWQTTSANVLGVLAVNAFSQLHETGQGQGSVSIASNELHDITAFDWQDIQTKGTQNVELPWPYNGKLDLSFKQSRQGSGWVTVVSKAALEHQPAVNSGIAIERSISPVSQANPDYWSIGDIYRVKLKITSDTEVFWAALSDPVPAGASILGTSLGRDSAIASQDESQDYWDYPSFIERDADTFRAYYEFLAPGEHSIEYTVRLNNAGDFNMPDSRVQALYQADVFGVLPNSPFVVKAGR